MFSDLKLKFLDLEMRGMLLANLSDAAIANLGSTQSNFFGLTRNHAESQPKPQSENAMLPNAKCKSRSSICLKSPPS